MNYRLPNPKGKKYRDNYDRIFTNSLVNEKAEQIRSMTRRLACEIPDEELADEFIRRGEKAALEIESWSTK